MHYGPGAGIIAAIPIALGIITLSFVHAVHQARSVQAADVVTSILIAVCGDGIVHPGQVCDQGSANNTGEYASSTAERICLSDCSGWGPYCGDSILQVRFDEECDEGGAETATCSADCKAKTPPPPGPSGSPTVGSIPTVPGAVPGQIPAQNETRVVVRGKAYPNASVNILLDGEIIGIVQADSNADFLFNTSNVTPGTATFGFWARDRNNITSVTVAAVFEVVQSAVTTMSNIFLPPTLGLSENQVQPGEQLNIFGQSVPQAEVTTEISGGGSATSYEAEVDASGDWALQLDTGSFPLGPHLAKARFVLSSGPQSGFGRAVNLVIGSGPVPASGTADINGDGRVNLVDFSIFLTDWGSSNARSDFNGDGRVNLADFSIMLFQWTG